MTQRLPTPGSDNGTWGTILNDFLAVSLNSDGTLQTTALTAAGAEVVTNKGQPSGYASLTSAGLIPPTQLGSGTASSSNYLRGDGSWVTPAGGVILDTTATDIQPDTTSGSAATGSTGQAADAGHQHPLVTHDHSTSNEGGNIPESSVANLTTDLSAKLSTTTAATTYAPLASPTFSGTLTTPVLKVTTGAGTANQVLTSDSSGTATWAAPSTGAVASVDGMTGTVTGLLQASSNLSDVADTGSSRANIHVSALTPAAAVAVANVATLSGTSAIDGYSPAATDLILLTAQTTTSQNGLWQLPTGGGAWTRPTEFASGATIKGSTCRILNGTSYSGSDWTLKSPTAGIIVDTSSQNWVQLPYPLLVNGLVPVADLPISTATTVRATTGSPTALATDINGDFALDVPNQMVYGPFSGNGTSGTWPAGVSFGSNSTALPAVVNWAASTAYIVNQVVLSPIGAYVPGATSLVQAIAAFTSGASFSTTNWTHLADMYPNAVAAPGMFGYFGWTLDPLNAGGSFAYTAGHIFLVRFRASVSGSCGHIGYNVNTAAAALTSGENFIGIYDTGQTSSGTATLLGQSADQSSIWTTAGYTSTALTSAVSLSAGQDYFVAFLGNGTTLPALATSEGHQIGLVNAGLSGISFRMGNYGTSLTTLPSTITGTSVSDGIGADYPACFLMVS